MISQIVFYICHVSLTNSIMAYVTNAKGEVIYTGRTLRGSQSGVKDVQNTATVVGEEYYNVNGIKLTSPTIAILWFFSAFAFGLFAMC